LALLQRGQRQDALGHGLDLDVQSLLVEELVLHGDIQCGTVDER
jgi:hypothetical protein